MAVNVPSYEPLKFSFGPGVLYLAGLTAGGVGAVVDPGDLEDVGAVRSGGTFNVSRTVLDVPQGSPITTVKQFITAESASLSVNGLEWDLSQLRLALGAGVVDEVGPPETFGFGGDLNIVDTAVKFVHVMPSGYTVTLRIWQAQSSADMTVTFGDDLHEFPYAFNALNAANEWSTSTGSTGAALATDEQLFRITLQKT